MAFFKKWTNSSKHSKLSEEWSLATSMKDFAVNSDDIDTDSEEPETFDVKYLGCTIIDAVRSEEATAEAVHSVITTAKASRKKLPRVTLCVSPKGIEMFDALTGDTMLQVSIYKISYCSADAAHSDVFAFVGTECGPDIDPLDEQLTCYAFLCGKRKIAQKVTLTVAHSFKQAYQIWQDASARTQYQLERRANRKQQQQQQQSALASTTATPPSAAAAANAIGAGCVAKGQAANVVRPTYRSGSSHSCSDDEPHDLLIDFGSSSSSGSSGGRTPEAWVSFDDDSTAMQTPSVWDTTLKSRPAATCT